MGRSSVSKKPKEGVTLDDNARAHADRKRLRNRRLPGAGRTRDNEQRSHVAILSRPDLIHADLPIGSDVRWRSVRRSETRESRHHLRSSSSPHHIARTASRTFSLLQAASSRSSRMAADAGRLPYRSRSSNASAPRYARSSSHPAAASASATRRATTPSTCPVVARCTACHAQKCSSKSDSGALCDQNADTRTASSGTSTSSPSSFVKVLTPHPDHARC